MTMSTMFKDGLLKDKRILVTGGGTGLGEVMAEAYAELGSAVYICGRRAAVLDETAKKISDKTGAKVKGIPCDIRVAEAVDDMIAQIWADGGALTGLVNNAAGNFISRTKDLPRAASTPSPTSSSAARSMSRSPAANAGSTKRRKPTSFRS